MYCSAWRIENATTVFVASEDPREQLEKAVPCLDGKVVSRISVERPSLSTTCEFADGTVLRTFSVFSAEYEHWMLNLPDGTVLTAGPGTVWSFGREDRDGV